MRLWRLWSLFVAVLSSAGWAGVALAAFADPVPAFDTVQGPASTHGIVIWSHGRSPDRELEESRNPNYLRAFRDAGWDVVRFNRERADDHLEPSARQLLLYVDRYRAQGYRRVVLAGQSYGAFFSLMAAGRSDAVDAVIATAPAAYGTKEKGQYGRNASELFPVLRTVRHGRAMIFYFDNDDYDPGDRADPSRRILGENGVDAQVFDRPAGFSGHGAGSSGLFARRFGACLVRFAEGLPVKGANDCDSHWGERPSPEMARAAGGLDRVMPAAAVANPFLGHWYGAYGNGREVMLVVHGTDAQGRIAADYVFGPQEDKPEGKVEWTSRLGRVDNGALIFDEGQGAILSYRPNPAGGLDAEWRDRKSSTILKTVLRRVR